MEFYNKLNAAERLVTIGAAIVIISWIVGLAGGFGFGANTVALLGAIAVLAIYFLKYSPTQSVNWPAPVPLIVLGISAVVALLAVVGALPVLSLLGGLAGFFAIAILALIGTAVGAVIMAWGAWQEYQAMPKTTPPSSNNPPAA